MANGVAGRNGLARPQGLRVGQPFNPYRLFAGVFIPEALVRYRGLSCGAKLAYGRLARFAGENGDCFPSIAKLAVEIGKGTTQAREYVHELIASGFIAREERPGTSAVYMFLWHKAFEGDVGRKRTVTPLRKTVGVPLRESGAPPLRKTGDEENHHQENQSKERHSFPSTQEKAAGKGAQNDLPKLAVDDDETPPKQPTYGSPWEEIRASFQRANAGIPMSAKDEWWVKERMELRGISAERLLDLVKENPLSGFASPIAGLKWLVKSFRSKTRSIAESQSEAEAIRIPMVPVEFAGCGRCKNTGRILEHAEGEASGGMDQYCDCPMGKDLRLVERGKPIAAGRLSEGGTETGPPSWRPALAGSTAGDRHAVN